MSQAILSSTADSVITPRRVTRSVAPVTSQQISGTARWAGRALSGLAVSFLLFDSVIKVVVATPVVDAMTQLGIPLELAPGIGVLELALVALFLVPRASTLGAVLLTGFLGGAILSHLRVGDPWLGYTLFPVYVGALIWGGLYLRDARLRNAVAELTRSRAS